MSVASGSGRSGDAGLYGPLLEAVRRHQAAVLVTVLDAGPAPDSPAAPRSPDGRKVLFVEGRKAAGDLEDTALEALAARLARDVQDREAPEIRSQAGVRLLLEPFAPAPTLLVVGAGHVARPVAALGSMLGLRVVVVDDRPEYANRQRFPEAERVLVGDFARVLGEFPITPRTYVVIVTRGHKYDALALQTIIARPAAYIGMIGSRRRVQHVIDALRAAGVAEERLSAVYAPIGLDIGAETPAEIAVSIVAEIIRVRRGGKAASLRLADRLAGRRATSAGASGSGAAPEATARRGGR